MKFADIEERGWWSVMPLFIMSPYPLADGEGPGGVKGGGVAEAGAEGWRSTSCNWVKVRAGGWLSRSETPRR